MKEKSRILRLSIAIAIGVLSIAQFGVPLAQHAFAASSNQEDNSGPDKDCKQEGPGNVDHDASCKNGVESENKDKGQNEN
jgi:hypothetical protein